MKYIFAFIVNMENKEAELINQDHEGSKTYRGAVEGWFKHLDGVESSIDGTRWAIIEWED